MGHSISKMTVTLLLAVSIPCASFADDAAENGSSFSFKGFLNKILSGSSSSSSSETPSSTTETTENSTDHSGNITDKIIDRFTAQPNYTNQMPQNNMNMQLEQRTLQESLVRCMYLGKFVEMNTAFSEQDADAQVKAKRAGELYANLKCNESLASYQDVWKKIDLAIGNCVNNDDCQNLNPAGGQVKTLPAPARNGTTGTALPSNAPASGGIKTN